jgi:hypothetical protein
VPVFIERKLRYAGTITLQALNAETVVVDIPPQPDDYMVEGYIDVSTMEPGDSVVIREYISVDGKNLNTFNTIAISNPTAEPVVRLHTKTLLSHMSYRVTVMQTTGTPRSFPYAFIVEIMGTA